MTKAQTIRTGNALIRMAFKLEAKAAWLRQLGYGEYADGILAAARECGAIGRKLSED